MKREPGREKRRVGNNDRHTNVSGGSRIFGSGFEFFHRLRGGKGRSSQFFGQGFIGGDKGEANEFTAVRIKRRSLRKSGDGKVRDVGRIKDRDAGLNHGSKRHAAGVGFLRKLKKRE